MSRKRKGKRRCLGCGHKIAGSTYDDTENNTPGPFCGPCLGLPITHCGETCVGCMHPITGSTYHDSHDSGPFCGPCIGQPYKKPARTQGWWGG